MTPGSGTDLVVGGKAAAKALRDDYLAHHYHQPSDEFDPFWNFSGLEADVEVLHTMGDTLANSAVWPNWHDGSEFRAARDKIMKKAK